MTVWEGCYESVRFVGVVVYERVVMKVLGL